MTSIAAIRHRRRDAAAELATAVSRTVAGEVRFDPGSRALYATDLSIYRQVPVGVVIPRRAEDVIATVEACRQRDVPILGRGCGTSLTGQTCNVAVVIDFSKYMNRILALDPDAKLARVEPGLINDQLREAAKQHGLTFAPDPATHQYCTLGGNIGNNSCGAHTVMGGKTADNVEELEILTYDGLRMHVGATPDDAYDLIRHAGGRRAEIYAKLKALAATLRLLPFPPARALLLLSYDDIAHAADDVVEIRQFGPTAIEGFDEHLTENMRRKGKALPGLKLLPEGDAWLLVEFGGENQKDANSLPRTCSPR